MNKLYLITIISKLSRKIKDLKYVAFKYKIRLFFYQLKKELHLKYNEQDYLLNSFLTTILINYNGFLVKEDLYTYTADFKAINNAAYRITLRKLPSSDLAVYKQIFVYKEYQPLVDLVRQNLNEIKSRKLNIIDAGGNIGATTIFLHNFFPDSNFIVVEPEMNNFNILERNIKQNNIENSSLILGGVWDKDTYLETIRDFRDQNDWGIRVIETSKHSDLEGLSLITLMQIRNFEVIDILKIDIEGSEKQLFSDHYMAGKFLSITKYIAIEIHDEFNCRNDIIECLKENAFDFFYQNETLFGINKRLI